jgi:hypothetical protein
MQVLQIQKPKAKGNPSICLAGPPVLFIIADEFMPQNL